MRYLFSIPVIRVFLVILALLAAACSTNKPPSTAAATLPGGTSTATDRSALRGMPVPVPGRTAVPLERNQRSLFVRAIFNGRMPARLLVDTGAAYVTIHEDLARSLGIDLSHTESVACILADSSQAQAHRAYLNQIQLGDSILRNVPVLVMPTRPNASHDGLLGMSFLERFTVEISVEDSTLWLTTRSPVAVPRNAPGVLPPG